MQLVCVGGRVCQRQRHAMTQWIWVVEDLAGVDGILFPRECPQGDTTKGADFVDLTIVPYCSIRWLLRNCCEICELATSDVEYVVRAIVGLRIYICIQAGQNIYDRAKHDGS